MRTLLLALLLACAALTARPARAEVRVALRYFEDTTAAMPASEVVARAGTLPWKAVPHEEPSFGQSSSRIWVRFTLPPGGYRFDDNNPLFVEIASSYLSRVSLYEVSGGRIREEMHSGLAVPVRDRSPGVLRTGFTVFRLFGPPVPGKEYFVSIQGRLPLSLPLSVWDASEYPMRHGITMLIVGVYLGCFLLAMLTNAIIAVILRSTLYANYALFVLSMIGIGLSTTGLSVLVLWSDSPWWAEREMIVMSGVSLYFYTAFIREFLQTRKSAPWLDRVLVACVAISGVRCVWLMFGYQHLLAVAGAAASAFNNLVAVYVAILAIRRKVPGAWLFLVASFLFDLGIVVFMGQELGWFWIAGWAKWSPFYGSLVEVVLLSIALANRIRHANRMIAHQRAAMVHDDKIAALGRMAGEIAHEISNPLAIIHGNAVLIRNEAEAPPRVREFAGTIESTANRITKVVKGMRSLSRDTRRDPFRAVAIDSILQDASALCHETAKNRGVTVTLPAADPDLRLRCRGEELCQVLVNLMGNSLDALVGAREPRLSIEVERKNGFAEISVADNGPGVPDALRTQILEPFFTTKEAGKGLGLGLSISRTIVESHGGRLWLAASPRGARFVFTIPLAT